jgi:hypothetical protein
VEAAAVKTEKRITWTSVGRPLTTSPQQGEPAAVPSVLKRLPPSNMRRSSRISTWSRPRHEESETGSLRERNSLSIPYVLICCVLIFWMR